MLVNQLNSKKDDAKSAEKGPVRGFEEILKARETMIRKQTIATQQQQEQEIQKRPANKQYQENGYNYKQFIVKLIDDKKNKLIDEALQRGIKQEHLDEQIENDGLMDFDIENLIQRMIAEGLLTKENGYDDMN